MQREDAFRGNVEIDGESFTVFLEEKGYTPSILAEKMFFITGEKINKSHFKKLIERMKKGAGIRLKNVFAIADAIGCSVLEMPLKHRGWFDIIPKRVPNFKKIGNWELYFTGLSDDPEAQKVNCYIYYDSKGSLRFTLSSAETSLGLPFPVNGECSIEDQRIILSGGELHSIVQMVGHYCSGPRIFGGAIIATDIFRLCFFVASKMTLSPETVKKELKEIPDKKRDFGPMRLPF